MKRAQRVWAVGATSVALAVAAAILMPRLVSTGTRKHTSAGPAPATSVAASTTPTAQPSSSLPFLGDYYVYRDDSQGWQLDVPPDWRSGIFEGTTEFVPPRATFPEVGKPTFWIAVSIREGAPAGPHKGPPVTADTAMESRIGEPAITGFPNGGESRLYRYDWTGLCVAANECPAGAVTLQVVIQGTDSHWWGSYGDIAQKYLQTMTIAKDSKTPLGDVHTRYGIVDAVGSDGYDSLTSTLVRFLDARVEQGGAEAFMTSQAKRAFATSATCSSLYESRTGHVPWMSYEIMVGRATDKRGQTGFTVIMSAGSGTPGCGESLVVGMAAGSTAPMILSATYQSLGED